MECPCSSSSNSPSAHISAYAHSQVAIIPFLIPLHSLQEFILLSGTVFPFSSYLLPFGDVGTRHAESAFAIVIGHGMPCPYHAARLHAVYTITFHHTPSPSGLPLSQGEKVGNNAQPSLSL